MPRTIELNTEYGKLEVMPLGGDRVRITAGIPHNVTDERLWINGVPYSAQGFMYRWSDGQFRFGREDDRMSQLHECNLKRTDRFSNNEASTSAQRKAERAITTTVNKWSKTPQAVYRLADAAYFNAREIEGRAHEALEEARQAVEDAEGEVEEAQVRTAAAERARNKAHAAIPTDGLESSDV